jgi:hypothetical protein
MLYYDTQVDDARYTLTVARTAAAHGAVVATRVSAVELLRSADGGRVTGARVRNEVSLPPATARAATAGYGADPGTSWRSLVTSFASPNGANAAMTGRSRPWSRSARSTRSAAPAS